MIIDSTMNRAEINFRYFCDSITDLISEHVPSNYYWHVVGGLSACFFVVVCGLNYILPTWLQYLIVCVVAIMVWSFLRSNQASKPALPENSKSDNSKPTNYSVTTTSALSEAAELSPIRAGVKNLSVGNDMFRHASSRSNFQKDSLLKPTERDDSLETNSTGTVGDSVNLKGWKKKEPLDPITLSMATSPGFTTRLIQRRDNTLIMNNSFGSSPLRESNSLYSSFAGSPSRSPGGIGGSKPIGPYKPAPKLNPPSFTSPVNGSKYSAVRRRKQDPYGTSYVPMASVESINQGINAVANSSKSSMGTPGSPIINDRAAGVAYASGMGGFPSPQSNRNYPKLWSPPVSGPMDGMSPYDSSRRAPSPGGMSPGSSDSMSRKRNRFMDGMGDKRVSPIRPGSPAYMKPSDEILKQGSKRTKYVQSNNDMRFGGPSTSRNSPYMALTDLPHDESMTSESILEQMNQTEKRFLPDDDSVPPRSPRKSKSGGVSKNSLDAAVSPYRKRRIPSHSITTLMEEEQSERGRGFCECTECYNEAAGMSKSQQEEPQLKTSVVSIPSVKRKKLVSFHHSMQQYEPTHQGVIKAASKPDTEDNDVTQKYTPVRMQIITKAKYEADRKKRQERLARMIKDSYKKSDAETGQSIPSTSGTSGFSSGIGNGATATFSDQVDGGTAASVFGSSNSGFTTTTTSSPSAGQLSFGTSSADTSVLTSNATTTKVAGDSGGFSFGLSKPAQEAAAKPDSGSSATTTTGFSFGSTTGSVSTQSSTTTTETTSAAKPAFSFGTSATTAATAATSTGPSFGGGSITSPVAPISTSSNISGLGSFFNTSTSSTVSSAPSSVPASTASDAQKSLFTTAGSKASDNVVSGNNSGGFSFGNSVGMTSNNAATVTTSASAPAFSFGSPAVTASPGQSVSATTTAQSGFSFGAGSATTTAAGSNTVLQPAPASANDGAGLKFGIPSPHTVTTTTPATSASVNFGAPNSTSFAFGQSNPATTAAQNASTTQPGLQLNFGQAATTAATTTSSSAQPAVGNIFGQTQSPPSTTSIFGQSGTSTPTVSFGQTSNIATTKDSGNGQVSGGFSFGATPASTVTQFGGGDNKANQPPTFGQTNSGTGGSVFGQSSAPQTGSTFGQATPTTKPPEYGATNTSSFGSSNFSFGQSNTTNPSVSFGQNTTATAFGQTSSSTPSFGQTSTSTPSFGQTSGAAPSFGQTSASTPSFGSQTTSSIPTFGQSSSTPSFGQSATSPSVVTFGSGAAASPFGQQQSGTTSSPFGGQQNASAGAGVFGSSASTPSFGANNNASTATSPFGGTSSSIFGQQSGNTPAFGSGNTGSTFGSSAQNTTSPFGSSATSPTFGSNTQPATSPFGSSNQNPPPAYGSTPQSGSSTFGSSTQVVPTFGSSSAASTPFGQGNTQQQQQSGGNMFGQSNNNAGSGGAFAFGQSGTSNTSSGAFGSSQPQQQNKPLFGDNAGAAPASGAFQFGQQQQTQSNPSSTGFNFGAAAANASSPAANFGGGFNQQPAQQGFGAQNPPTGGFQFGQQAASPGAFNFGGQQQPPAFGSPQPQGQMFTMGAASTGYSRSGRGARPRSRR